MSSVYASPTAVLVMPVKEDVEEMVAALRSSMDRIEGNPEKRGEYMALSHLHSMLRLTLDDRS